MSSSSAAPILLFDGVCNVCNFAVRFVIENEREPRMLFASLQSDYGKKLIAERNIVNDLDTVLLIDGERVHHRSSAVVRVLRTLRAPWPLIAMFLWLVPFPLRNLGYDIFAAVRYRVFGKRESCLVPTPALRARFLDGGA